MNLNNEMATELIHQANDARKNSYAPYSQFTVGAALHGKSGRIYTGCNVENAAYSPSNCAERTAFFKAISEGEKEFDAIAVVGGKYQESLLQVNSCYPCGVCRQVMLEFCDPDQFVILVSKKQEGSNEKSYEEHLLSELTPFRFDKSNL